MPQFCLVSDFDDVPDNCESYLTYGQVFLIAYGAFGCVITFFLLIAIAIKNSRRKKQIKRNYISNPEANMASVKPVTSEQTVYATTDIYNKQTNGVGAGYNMGSRYSGHGSVGSKETVVNPFTNEIK